MNAAFARPGPVTAGSDRSPDVIGRGGGMEQKCAGPMAGPVMEQFEKCFDRALVIPLNQTVKMQSARFTSKCPLRTHE